MHIYIYAYRPGETHNRKCLDLTERRSFYRKRMTRNIHNNKKYIIQTE